MDKELIERVRGYSSRINMWRNDHSSIEYRESEELSRSMFGKGFSNVRNCVCVDDFFLNLEFKISKNQNGKIMEKKFQFRKGLGQMSFAVGYVDENSTDEQAIELLRENPKHADKFERIPSNWQDIVSGKVKSKSESGESGKSLEDMGAGELKDFAASQLPAIELTGKNKKENLSIIQKELETRSANVESESEEEDSEENETEETED